LPGAGQSPDRQIDADAHRTGPALAQPRKTLTEPATEIEHAGGLQADELEALKHPPFNLAQQKVGGCWVAGASIELTPNSRTV
jgi:hypothetical protein